MSIDNNAPSSPPASVPSEKLGSPLSSVASDSTPTTLMHQDAVTTANTVTPSQGNNGTSTLPSHTAILAEDAMPPQQHTALDPSQHPTFDNMDVDMVDANAQQLASADNASHLQELQSTANELTKQMSVASAKLPFLHGESRRVAVQEIQDLALTIKASNDLLVSFASMNQPGLSNSDAAASSSPTVLSPNNLPYFQWEGAVFDARHPWSVDVDACLTNFEDVMCFYRIDFDKEFRRLVPPMLSPTQRTWYQSFLSSHEKPTWMDFKSNFKARYGISVLDDRQKCAAALMNISFNPNESLASVVDRLWIVSTICVVVLSTSCLSRSSWFLGLC